MRVLVYAVGTKFLHEFKTLRATSSPFSQSVFCWLGDWVCESFPAAKVAPGSLEISIWVFVEIQYNTVSYLGFLLRFEQSRQPLVSCSQPGSHVPRRY